MKKTLQYLLLALSISTLAQNTTLLKDITPGASHSDIEIKGHIGDTLIFTNDPDAAPMELWMSNGTALGTIKLATAQSSNARFTDVVTSGKKMAIVEYDQSNIDYYIWITDGTVAGTTKLTHNSTYKSINGLKFFDDTLYYFYNKEIHKADIDNAADEVIYTDDNYIIDFFPVSATFFYIGREAANSSDEDSLFSYDLTTQVYENLMPIGYTYFQEMKFAPLGNKLLFFNKVDNSELNLYVTDGTPAGSSKLKAYYTNGLGSANEIITHNGKIYFDGLLSLSDPDTRGYELWVSDGTTVGTYSLYSNTNKLNYAESICIHDNYVYFHATDNNNYNEYYYKTDGTINGTVSIFSNKINTYYYNGIVRANNKLYMLARLGNDSGTEFWESDGTSGLLYETISGTDFLYDDALYSTTNKVFFVGNESVYGRELYLFTPQTPSVLSIQNGAASLQIQYAPNPVNSTLSFDLVLDKISVYDIQGKQVLESINTSNISMEELPAGTYLVTAVLDNRSAVIRIAKQ